MDPAVFVRARLASRLSQADLAARAGTSRTTLSAYEHGRKSPTVETAGRILRSAGFDLVAVPQVTFREEVTGRGRPFFVADQWWTLPPDVSFAEIALPVSLNWSMPGMTFSLADRHQRGRCYEIVLREGSADDIVQMVNGALLIDLWDDLVLPQEIRAAWQPLIDAVAV